MKRTAAFLIILAGLFTVNSASALSLSSPDFNNNGKIPTEFSCRGKSIVPTLVWDNAPQATKSFVLVVQDPDAPNGNWVHWLVYNIPSTAHGISNVRQLGTLGKNSWGNLSYGAPCPPSGVHHYVFTLYALNAQLQLSTPARLDDVNEAMQANIIDKAQLIGLYP